MNGESILYWINTYMYEQRKYILYWINTYEDKIYIFHLYTQLLIQSGFNTRRKVG